MEPDKRKPPGGLGRLSRSVLADGFDVLRDTPTGPRKQALLRRARARFARSMVFEEFRYKHARAIDYDDFHDRWPDQAPRRWRAVPW